MNAVDQQNAQHFLDRFWGFNDAVVQSVELRYIVGGSRQVKICLSAHDSETSQGWTNVDIVIDSVSEVLLHEGRATRQILSDGLTIVFHYHQIWCDFSPYSSGQTSLEFLRRSDFLIAGGLMSWRSGHGGE